jgi:hypothetical protein
MDVVSHEWSIVLDCCHEVPTRPRTVVNNRAEGERSRTVVAYRSLKYEDSSPIVRFMALCALLLRAINAIAADLETHTDCHYKQRENPNDQRSHADLVAKL